jgi:hypothetical protein
LICRASKLIIARWLIGFWENAMAAIFVCLCAITAALSNASLDAFLVRVEATPWPIETKKAPARIERDNDGDIVGLRLDGVRLEPGDIDHVASLGLLERLSLNRTTITDDGLTKLAELRRLRGLSFNHTRISDRGIDAFQAHPNLRSLCLFDTNVTREAVRALNAKNNRLQLGYAQSKD